MNCHIMFCIETFLKSRLLHCEFLTDVSPMDGVNGSLQREVTLRTVVRVPPQHIIKGVSLPY